jgi:hypothetical protein
MKASFTFDLDLPEDKTAHLRCTKALDLVFCLESIENNLYKRLKYDDITSKERDLLINMGEFLSDTMREYGIDLDELNR